MKFWKRPRTLLLSALLLLAAFMIWKDSQRRAEEGKEHVKEWVTQAVEQAAANRELSPDMGATSPVIADTLSAWVRNAVPPDRVPSVRVQVDSQRESMTDAGEATHKAVVHVGDAVITLYVVWDGTNAHAVRADREP